MAGRTEAGRNKHPTYLPIFFVNASAILPLPYPGYNIPLSNGDEIVHRTLIVERDRLLGSNFRVGLPIFAVLYHFNYLINALLKDKIRVERIIVSKEYQNVGCLFNPIFSIDRASDRPSIKHPF